MISEHQNPEVDQLEQVGAAQQKRRSRRQSCLRSAEFLARNGDLLETETRTGYNPMMEDYDNTSILLAQAGKEAHRIKYFNKEAYETAFFYYCKGRDKWV